MGKSDRRDPHRTNAEGDNEFGDQHARAVILRGGIYYRSQGSRWHFSQAHRLDGHGKHLLMALSLDRAGTLGFRCVKDAK